jgi:hypothetical protein
MESCTPDIRRYTTDSSFGIDSLGASYEPSDDICRNFDILKEEYEVNSVEMKRGQAYTWPSRNSISCVTPNLDRPLTRPNLHVRHQRISRHSEVEEMQ